MTSAWPERRPGKLSRIGSELKVHRPSGQTDVIWGDSLVTGEEVGGLEEKKNKNGRPSWFKEAVPL